MFWPVYNINMSCIHGDEQRLDTICMVAEEEVRPEERQLALRPMDMSFEQAMLHYMAQMNDRQACVKTLS